MMGWPMIGVGSVAWRKMLVRNCGAHNAAFVSLTFRQRRVVSDMPPLYHS